MRKSTCVVLHKEILCETRVIRRIARLKVNAYQTTIRTIEK